MQEHFLNNGYRVYGTGKLFHEGAGGPFYTQYGIPPNYGPWPWKGKGKEEMTAHPAQVGLFSPFLPENMQRELNFSPLADVPEWKPDPAGKFPGYNGWYSFGKPWHYVNDDDRDQMPDEISADFAVKVLSQKHDAPFFLGVGFIRPHVPLYVPTKYFDKYPLESVKLPPYLTNDLADCAVILQQHWRLGFQKFDAIMSAGGVTMWRQWVQAYLASMSFADDQVGKVLDALDKSPYRDNTIVVLIGDNGYHLGEKSAIQKWYLWEESTKVPFFIRAPGAARGKICKLPTSLIDLYPTLIDLCGLPKSPNTGKSEAPLGGHSLRPLLKNPVHGTWDGPPAALSVVSYQPDGTPGTGPHYSIRTIRWRYTLCSNGEEEMYDHDADPNEWTNLAKNPNYAQMRRDLRAQLTKLVQDTTGPEQSKPQPPKKKK
jgi:arylsulfatase A-like enzyme